jgi:hypothetical protein
MASYFNVSADYLLGIDKKKMVSVDGLSDRQVNNINELIEDIRRK